MPRSARQLIFHWKNDFHELGTRKSSNRLKLATSNRAFAFKFVSFCTYPSLVNGAISRAQFLKIRMTLPGCLPICDRERCFSTRHGCGFGINAVVNRGNQGNTLCTIEGTICDVRFSEKIGRRALTDVRTPAPAQTETLYASHKAGDSGEKSGESAEEDVLVLQSKAIHDRTQLSHFPAESETATTFRLILESNGWKEDTVQNLHKLAVKITSDLIVDVASQLKNVGVAWHFLNWARTQEGDDHGDEIFTKVIGRLGRQRDFSSAWHLLDRMRQQGMDVNYAFSIFIHRLRRAKMVDGVVKAMNGMKYLTVIPTVPLYTSALQFLLKANSLGQAQRLHHQMVQDGVLPDKKLYELIAIGFGRAGKLDDTLIILQDMERQGYIPEILVYTTIVGCFSMVGKLDEGRKLYLEMIRNNCLPEIFTYHELACALHGENTMELVEKFLEVVETKGSDLKIHTYNNLLQYLFNIGKHDEAKEVFHRIPGNKQAGKGFGKQLRECRRNLDTYKYYIFGICKGGHLVHALEIFKAMLVSGPQPDDAICSYLLLDLSNAKMMDEALELLPHVMKLKVRVSDDAQQSFFSTLRSCGRLDRACKVFKAMKRKGCIDEDSDFVSIIGLENKEFHT